MSPVDETRMFSEVRKGVTKEARKLVWTPWRRNCERVETNGWFIL